MATLTLGKKPAIKLSSANKQKAKQKPTPGFYFERKREHKIRNQEERKASFQWKGYISPSAQLHFGLCMDQMMKNLLTFTEFDLNGMYLVDDGNIYHRGTESEDKDIPGLLYAKPPNLPPSLASWHEKIKPELPLECNRTRVKGKIDRILDIDGLPAPMDIKSNQMEPKFWPRWADKYLPKAVNFFQVALYYNRLLRAKYWPQLSPYFGLCHNNLLMRGNAPGREREFWWQYNKDLDSFMQTWLKEANRRINYYLRNEKLRCTNPFCDEHGQDEFPDQETWAVKL